MTQYRSPIAYAGRISKIALSTTSLAFYGLIANYLFDISALAESASSSKMIGCWIRENDKDLEEKIGSASMCLSISGSIHGVFIENNGLGGDDDGKWYVINKSKVSLLGETCEYVFQDKLSLILRECSLSGKWAKKTYAK